MNARPDLWDNTSQLGINTERAYSISRFSPIYDFRTLDLVTPFSEKGNLKRKISEPKALADESAATSTVPADLCTNQVGRPKI